MAGHSQFKNIMHRKGAQDAKRAKIFTKIIREIITAAKNGLPDPASNPRLRAAIALARAENMPKDKVEQAIKRGSGDIATEAYDGIRYEGYGPGGIAVIVETLTDNRNRTASDIRAIFTKYGGHLGEPGSVSFLFDHLGLICYPAAAASEEAMLEAAITAGADECESSAEGHAITCPTAQLHAVREALEGLLGHAESARFIWMPKTRTSLSEEQNASLTKMLDVLSDHDDVQQLFTNEEIAVAA